MEIYGSNTEEGYSVGASSMTDMDKMFVLKIARPNFAVKASLPPDEKITTLFNRQVKTKSSFLAKT